MPAAPFQPIPMSSNPMPIHPRPSWPPNRPHMRRMKAKPTLGGWSEHRSEARSAATSEQRDDEFIGAAAEGGGPMKLGLNLGYWGAGGGDGVEIVKHAEALGYDSVWTAEAYGSDAVVPLTWVGAHTTKIKLGSAILQMPARSPAMTAMTAATLDLLSGGRVLLGLGLSGPQVAEGWHGQRYGRQLQRTREYVAVVRMALARERVEFHGETLELPLPDGPGKP